MDLEEQAKLIQEAVSHIEDAESCLSLFKKHFDWPWMEVPFASVSKVKDQLDYIRHHMPEYQTLEEIAMAFQNNKIKEEA